MTDKSIEQIAQEINENLNAEEQSYQENLGSQVEHQHQEVEHTQVLDDPVETPKLTSKPRQSGRDNLIAEKNRHLREKRESDAAAQILAQKNAQLQDALEQQAAIEYSLRQQNLKLKEEFTSIYLAGAISENDHGTQTMLHKNLAELAAEKAQLTRDAEVRRARYTNYQDPVEQQYQQYQDQAPINEEFEDWRAKNTWFDTSEALRNEAITISNLLESSYINEGKGHLVATKSFMNEVTNKVLSNHGLNPNTSPQAPKPMARTAAPVSRNSQGAIANTQYGNKVILSAEESAMADALPLFKADGRTPLTFQEKRIIYAKNK